MVLFPAVEVSIAFTTDPLSDSPVWEDVTSYLRSFDVTRGRQRELEHYQTGRLTMVLDNRDRRFDSEYSGSPYAGYITPSVLCRIRATYGATTYPVFQGYVDSWDDTYVYPNEAAVTVVASDGFKVLNQADLESSAYVQELLVDGPVHWWRLNEPSDTATVYDRIGALHLDVHGTPQFGEPSPLTGEGDSAATFVDDATDGAQMFAPFPVAGGPMTVEFVIRTDAAPDFGNMVATVDIEGNGEQGVGFELGENPPHFIIFPTPGVVYAVKGPALAANTTYHLAGVWETNGQLRVYVNGVGYTTLGDFAAVGTSIAVASFPAAGYTIISTATDPPFENGRGLPGTYDEVAIYDYALSAARILAHAEAVGAWAGDTSGERIERVLDAVDWPDNLRDIDTGLSILQGVELGESALAHALTVRDSEFGELYVTRDGTVRFESRENTINQTVAATFGDDPDVGELAYFNLQFDHSEELIRNDVTVARIGGAPQHAKSDASIARHQRHSYNLEGLYHNDDGLSRDAAEFIVNEYALPLKRIESMTIHPRRDPANLFPQVLGRELTDWIIVKRRPQNIGDPIIETSVVEGIRHTVTPRKWETEWSLSPAHTGAYWQLGVTGLSELGETTRLFF